MTMLGRLCVALTVLVSLSVQSHADTVCLDHTRLAHSTVAITRYFDEAERATARTGVSGAQGTGWFLSPTAMVTVGHVAEGMKLSTQVWKPLEVRDGDRTRTIPVRIQHLAGAHPEKLAVLELREPVVDARGNAIRAMPLLPEDRVVTFAYPEGRARLVGGRFVQFGDGGRLEGTALLEMYDGNDRLAVDYGASGAPVFDCEGRVAAVVTTVVTHTLAWASSAIRISTPWGTPNVVAVPIAALEGVSGRAVPALH